MDDANGFRLEAAEQFGIREQEIEHDATVYLATESQLIAFAKACERKGLAEAKQLTRRELNNPLNAQAKSPLIALLGALKKRTDAFDAELTPIRKAEEARFIAGLCARHRCPTRRAMDQTGG